MEVRPWYLPIQNLPINKSQVSSQPSGPSGLVPASSLSTSVTTVPACAITQGSFTSQSLYLLGGLLDPLSILVPTLGLTLCPYQLCLLWALTVVDTAVYIYLSACSWSFPSQTSWCLLLHDWGQEPCLELGLWPSSVHWRDNVDPSSCFRFHPQLSKTGYLLPVHSESETEQFLWFHRN